MLSWLQLRSEGDVLERTHRKLYIERHKGRKEKRSSQAPVAQAQRVPTPWHSPVAAPLEAAGEATSKTTVESFSAQSDKQVPAGQQQAACLPAARGVGWPGVSASGDISQLSGSVHAPGREGQGAGGTGLGRPDAAWSCPPATQGARASTTVSTAVGEQSTILGTAPSQKTATELCVFPRKCQNLHSAPPCTKSADGGGPPARSPVTSGKALRRRSHRIQHRCHTRTLRVRVAIKSVSPACPRKRVGLILPKIRVHRNACVRMPSHTHSCM